MRKRTLLARSTSIATRQRVYLIAEGLEIDEIDHFEVRRSRVLFEEVLLMTYHRHRGSWFFFINGFFLVMALAVSGLIAQQDIFVGLITFAILGIPFLVAIVIRLIAGVDEINVYGRRTRATMRFHFRKERARTMFHEIANAVRRQQRVAPAAAPAPGVMPPPIVPPPFAPPAI